MTGYITKGIGGFYYVKTSEGIVECKPRGIFRKQKITPVAGDVVTLETENGAAVIADIAPRRNVFVRPPMANLDVLFLVASTTQPTPSTLVLDKLSAIAVDKGVQPVIVCTKGDLAEAEFLRSAYEKSTLPFIRIDYATGASWAEGEQGEIQSSPTPAGTAYVLNTNTKKFHLPTCASVEDMKPENRTDYTGSREALLDEGYSPCGQCKPESKTAAEPRSAAVFQRPSRKNRARNRAQDRMGKRTSTGRRRRGWLHVRGTRPSKPLDSMAMDSSSDQRTDLTSRGLSRAGETGKTRIPRAAKAARVRLYSSIILGRMPQAASRP